MLNYKNCFLSIQHPLSYLSAVSCIFSYYNVLCAFHFQSILNTYIITLRVISLDKNNHYYADIYFFTQQ